MRTHPAAFLPAAADVADTAILQGAMTHGHPTSHVATAAWAVLIRAAADGASPDTWLDVTHAAAPATMPEFLSDVAHRAYARTSPDQAAWWATGLQEFRDALAQTQDAATAWSVDQDPCDLTGEGWTAETAYATTLLVTLRYPDDPQAAVERAARTRGDSDSLASMVGALLGARHGQDAWPQDWVSALELRYRSEALSVALPRASATA